MTGLCKVGGGCARFPVQTLPARSGSEGSPPPSPAASARVTAAQAPPSCSPTKAAPLLRPAPSPLWGIKPFRLERGLGRRWAGLAGVGARQGSPPPGLPPSYRLECAAPSASPSGMEEPRPRRGGWAEGAAARMAHGGLESPPFPLASTEHTPNTRGKYHEWTPECFAGGGEGVHLKGAVVDHSGGGGVPSGNFIPPPSALESGRAKWGLRKLCWGGGRWWVAPESCLLGWRSVLMGQKGGVALLPLVEWLILLS